MVIPGKSKMNKLCVSCHACHAGGRGFLSSFFLQNMPALPFGELDCWAVFHRWVRSGAIVTLNPWALAAPEAFLKRAWCRHVQERQYETLLQVVTACLAAAAVAAAAGAPESSLTGMPSFSSLFSLLSSFFFFFRSRMREGAEAGCGGCGVGGSGGCGRGVVWVYVKV
jgi:hypothetical protein